MVKFVLNVTEFNKTMLYNNIKVVRLIPDQPNQWLRPASPFISNSPNLNQFCNYINTCAL